MTLVPADQGNGYAVQQYQPQYPAQQMAPVAQPVAATAQVMRLTEWADEARAAAALAASLVKTSFVPKAFAGRVEEATAAILTGAEMGLSPMASLRAIYVIHGTPGMYAKTMRAVVQSHGHEIWEHEATSTRVIMKGRRKGSAHVETSTWSMDRAKTAGLTSNDQYRKNPINMLRSRATAEVCWLVAADALSGIAASVEELEAGLDGSGEPVDSSDEEAKPARRTAKRKPLERAEGTEPPLPPARATVERAEPVDTEAAVSEPAETQPEMIRADQRRHMFALFNELGYSGDDNREQRLVITGKILRASQPLESSNDLTAAEADVVIAALADRKAKQVAQGGES